MPKINLNAWREIIARVFEGFTAEHNITPNWLVNPVTNRKLKLDLLYPEIGVAVRFEGLQARQARKRLSLEEEELLRTRIEARQDVCTEHGISLANLNLSTPENATIFRDLDLALSQASRWIKADDSLPTGEKEALLARLSDARGKATRFRWDIRTDRDLTLYAELWQDRLYKEAGVEESASVSAEETPTLAEGIEVEHSHFGRGTVTGIAGSGGDALVTIDFVTHGQRTFMASLLAGKVNPV